MRALVVAVLAHACADPPRLVEPDSTPPVECGDVLVAVALWSDSRAEVQCPGGTVLASWDSAGGSPPTIVVECLCPSRFAGEVTITAEVGP